MPRITFQLPSMLSRITGVPATFELEAESVDGALEAVVRRHRVLAVHLFDERGALREHVLCFHNDTNTRWLPSTDVPVQDGDRITVLQAVSGG